MPYAWEWFDQYQDKIYEDDCYGDRHVRMVDYFDAGTDDDVDPMYNIACLRKARRLSIALGEDLFTLWCDAWLGAELHAVGEFKKARELLAPAVLRAAKPLYANTPQQLMVHVHLAVTFVCSDPIGYEKEIKRLCAFIKKNTGDTHEHAEHAWQIEAALHIEKHDWNAAENAIAEFQQIIASCDDDGVCWSYSYLRARIAMILRNWPEMLKLADEGMLAPNLDQEHKKSFLFMRACALAALGDKKSAKTLYRRGSGIRRGVPDADDYTLSALYWLLMGDSQAAIRVRLDEQANAKGKGRYWEQIKSALHLVELYRSVNEQREASRWLRAAKRFLKNLRTPEACLAVLQELD